MKRGPFKTVVDSNGELCFWDPEARSQPLLTNKPGPHFRYNHQHAGRSIIDTYVVTADELPMLDRDELSAHLEQAREMLGDAVDDLAQIAAKFSVPTEPHQTFRERLLEAVDKAATKIEQYGEVADLVHDGARGPMDHSAMMSELTKVYSNEDR